MNIVFLARSFAVLVFLVFSFLVHYLLFREINGTYWNTIMSHVYMYIIYFLLSLLLAEHLLNFIKRRNQEDKE